MAPALQTKWPPVAPQCCWGSAVSDACRRWAVTCRLRIRSKAKASSPTHPLLLAVSYKVPKVPKSPLLLAGSKVPLNGTGSADQMATHWAWILLGFCCFGCVPTPGRYAPFADAAQKAKASSPTHPFLLAVSYKVPKVPKSPLLLAGLKVPKWHRLCRPNDHPLGLNPAGVLLFRMRAHAGPATRRLRMRPKRPKLPASPILCL